MTTGLVFSNQHWKLRVFSVLRDGLNLYHGKGRGRLRSTLEKMFFSNDEYFQVDYFLNSRLWVCPRHTVGKHVLREGVYEPITTSVIEAFMRKGFSFIDIGANIGTHTITAAKSQVEPGQQKIVAFEPFASTYEVLRRNCLLNNLPDVECVMAAISDTSGDGTLMEPTGDPAHVTMAISSAEMASGKSTKLIRLDDYFPESWDRPTLIKMDVQGSEPLVFRGGRRFIGQLSNVALIFEIDERWLVHAGFRFDDLREALADMKPDRFFMLEEKQKIFREATLASIEDNSADQHNYINVVAIKGSEAQAALDTLSE